jgi:hypothetical protein
MATHTEKLFGGANLQGGARSTIDSEGLQKIASDLLKYAEVEEVSRNPNPLQDAVVVAGDCPSGLIGCDAAELYKKTGGLLSCPPLEVAPDPLIVDYKGRLCYAPEDVKRQFEGKNLNVDDLIDKYSKKLLEMLHSGSNLRTAIDVAQRGPKGNPLVLNAYVNSPTLAAAVTAVVGAPATQAQIGEVAALLSKFTDKLIPSTGAELVNFIMNNTRKPMNVAGFGGGDIHARLSSLIIVGVIATSKDGGKASRFASLLNTLGEVLVFGDAGFQPGADAEIAALNAVSFLPLAFRQGLGQSGAVNTADGRVLLYRFVIFSLALSLGEILDNAIPERYCSAIQGLRIAFNDMRTKRDSVEQYMKRKVQGVTTGSSAEEVLLLEKKKGADRLYVARIVEFAKVCTYRLGRKFEDGFPAMIQTDSLNYLQKLADALARIPQPGPGTVLAAGLQALTAFINAVLYAGGFNLISFPFTYNLFFTEALRYSKTTAFMIPEDPAIFPAALKSASPSDSAGLKAAEAADKGILGPGAANIPVCKSYVGGVPVFLGSTIPQNAAEETGQRLVERQLLASTLYKSGLGADLALNINQVPSGAVSGVLRSNCFPITEPSDAHVRLAYTLVKGKPTDDVFTQMYPNLLADSENFNPRGLLAGNRDLYVKYLIFLSWIGDAEVVASMLYGQNLQAFARKLQAIGGQKVSTGTRLGGGEGEEEVIGGEIDIDSAADFFLSGGSFTKPAHQMPEGIADYLRRYEVDGKDGKEIRALQDKLAKRGYEVSFINSGSKCPSYAGTSNTFGAPGHKQWVETKSAWPKCMELMGFQFVTDKGFCYPYGMSCYDEDDVTSTTLKTEGKVANWNVLAEIYQEVQQKRYMEWMEREKARIRMDSINSSLTEDEITALALTHIPAEFKDIPDRASLLSLSVISSELSAAVNEFTTTNDPAQLTRLREILREGYLREEWENSDKYVEVKEIESKAQKLLEDTKVCTDAPTTGGVPAGCTEKLFPDPNDASKTIRVFIPDQINKEIDEEGLKRGEDVSNIVQWWQQYYGNRVIEKKTKEAKVAEKISPFHLPKDYVYKLQESEAAKHRPVSQQAALEKLLDATIHKKGKKGFNIAHDYAEKK